MRLESFEASLDDVDTMTSTLLLKASEAGQRDRTRLGEVVNYRGEGEAVSRE